jgi:Tfp pilus assembly protein FimT
MRRGTTLLELALVLVITGLALAMAVPAVSSLRDRLAVDGAAALLVSAHARARMIAAAEGRVVVLSLWTDSIVVQAVESPTDTVVRWKGTGPASHHVSMTGLPRQIAFGPNGIPLGFANGTYLASRGGARRQVVVSRYGRVRVF